MKLRLEQLASHLHQGLQPVYLISGDEPLLVQEACDAIRQTAKQAGFTERTLYQTDSQFQWGEFLASHNSLSLFAERKLIELRITNGKPGDEGSKALQAYCESLSEENLLLVVCPKLDKNSQRSKWFKALDNVGAHLAVWPVEQHELPRWIAARMKHAGLQSEPDAIGLLAELVDGNLLAATQEIEKLKLINSGEKIDCATIQAAVSDSSRHTVFDLVDSALLGDLAQTQKTLSGLRAEGVEPIIVIWALSREIRQLASMAQAIEKGQPAAQVMRQQGVWSKRQAITGKALARLSSRRLQRLLQRLALADRIMKGMRQGNLWDHLEQTALLIAGAKLAAY